MRDSVLDFYGALANDYHLISVSWEDALQWQGTTLDSLIKRFDSRRELSILDCSCGIGTQAIALSLRGYKVRASDISAESVLRAKQEAKRLNVPVDFEVADVRDLASLPGKFDLVVSFDNAIAHLLQEEDLQKATSSLFSKVSEGGRVFLSLRDYDELRRQKPTGTLPRHFRDEHGERVVVQNWEWSADSRSYDMTLFILEKLVDKWNVRSYSTTTFRAWLRHEIEAGLRDAGFVDVKWLEPADTGFYQPIITGKR